MKGMILAIGTVVVGVVAHATGWASPRRRRARRAAATKVGTASSTLGRILVDGHGRTLYLFAKDKNGKSACSGACAAYWPPLIASGKLHAGAGAKASLLGRTRRSDGRLQVTYRHHPLYRYAETRRKARPPVRA